MHINSTWALCPPRVRLDDGGFYHPNKKQKWLWNKWLDFIAEAKVTAIDHRRVVVINGDLTELDTLRRTIQLISLNKDTILAMAIQALTPLIEIADAVYIIRGTSAHTGRSNWSEEALGREIGAVQDPDGCYSWKQYCGVASGVRFDIAHHVTAGTSPFYAKNAGNKKAVETLWQYIVERDSKPPHLVIRSHNHSYATSGDNFPTEVNLMPAWTFKTEYAYRIGLENAISDIGGIIYYCKNGRYLRDKILYRLPGEKELWRAEM